MSHQHQGEADLARRLEGIRQSQAAAEAAREQAERLRGQAATNTNQPVPSLT